MKDKLLFITMLFVWINATRGNVAHIYGRHLEDNAKSGGAELRTLKSDSLIETPKIKVRVQKSLKNVFISGTDLKRKFHLSNDIQTFKGRKAIKFKCENFQSKSSFKKPILLASLGSSTGLIGLAKEKFKGLLHVVTSRENDSCDVIHETNLETYISSLLAREMNSKWPLEALKAQAIAARTYALHKMNSGQVKKEAGHETYYHIESSEKHQVSGNFFDANLNTELASQSTAGLVLVNENEKIAPIFFHAKCGGRTLRPEQVWQNSLKSYKAVPCPYCKDHGSQGFDNQITLKKWQTFLNWTVKKRYLDKEVLTLSLKEDLRIVPDKKYTRYIRFYLGERIFSFKKALLRRYFGRFIVPSNNFTLKLENAGPREVLLRVKGDGLGHGVGMCQLGALDLADKGWDYQKILSHYFPGHALKKIY
ncbi:MAG: SpoIID/LytB domain-containing protein [Bacteriovoracaceae bacterium]|nr:SpoIID/LytB domain-containing protein [Bacteriovoracaceae bacterium]